MKLLIFLLIISFSLNLGIVLPQATAAKSSVKKTTISLKKVSAQSITDAQLEQQTKVLRLKRKEMNAINFPYVVDENICQVLEKVKNTFLLSKNKKNNYLIEVIKTYDLVLDYSLDHNYFYCIYNNFKSKEIKQIIKLSKSHLSKSKANYFADRLAACHKEETEGNGDNPDQVKRSLDLLSSLDYKKLSFQDQLKYSTSLRKSYLELEKSTTSYSLNDHLNLLDIAFPSAFAAKKRKCLIGGLLRDVLYSKKLGRSVCSGRKNTCNGANTFRCGSLFNQKCVNFNPIKTLSKRCYSAVKDRPLSLVDYQNFMNKSHKDYQNYCKSKGGAACRYYAERVKTLTTLYSEKLIIEGAKINQTTEDTEASSVCIDCLKKQTQKNLTSLNEINQEMNSDMTKYLSDTVYNNSTCYCKPGSDRCQRGCLTKEQAKTGNGYIKHQAKCRSSKSKGKSRAKCMRHANGAIMNTINAFLAKYCEGQKDAVNSKKSLKQCYAKLPSTQTICNQSFVFPSALCALNLDEKDRISETTLNKRVKRGCRQKENEANKAIKTIKIIADDGRSIKEVPIFKEIPMPKDPEDLPVGAIVVMKSNSRHGHIEIKTDKKKCKGDSYCFCSDFCASRKGGYKPPFKPQVVFIFNPEVTDYFSEGSPKQQFHR